MSERAGQRTRWGFVTWTTSVNSEGQRSQIMGGDTPGFLQLKQSLSSVQSALGDGHRPKERNDEITYAR